MAAVALLDLDENRIRIRARLVFYGSAATPELAQTIVEEINRLYNEPSAEVELGGRLYRVFFGVEYALLPVAEVASIIHANVDLQNNFVRLENANYITRSFMGFALGDNVGHWITTDQLGISTTAAHEFGHALGLDHPLRLDYRGTNSPPPIMAPRGTLVDPPYQWEPKAVPGQPGGTMKPIHRKVWPEEIKEIVSRLRFNPDGFARIGHLSNILFDDQGQPGRGLA